MLVVWISLGLSAALVLYRLTGDTRGDTRVCDALLLEDDDDQREKNVFRPALEASIRSPRWGDLQVHNLIIYRTQLACIRLQLVRN